MRTRIFVTTDDLLTLQNICERTGRATLTIGGPPDDFDSRLDGFERASETGRGRIDWSVCYLGYEKPADIYAVRALFRITLAQNGIVTHDLADEAPLACAGSRKSPRP